MSAFARYITKKNTTENITVVCPVEHRREIEEALHQADFKVTHGGCPPAKDDPAQTVTGTLTLRVDTSQYRFEASRILYGDRQ